MTTENRRRIPLFGSVRLVVSPLFVSACHLVLHCLDLALDSVLQSFTWVAAAIPYTITQLQVNLQYPNEVKAYVSRSKEVFKAKHNTRYVIRYIFD